MQKNALFFLFFYFYVFSCFSQSKISGTVRDKTGEGLYGATIKIKGKSATVITDLSGKYSIEALPSDVLVFSALGMKNEEVKVGEKTSIDIYLQEDVTELSNVVVSAFGMTREKKSLGYAVQAVEGEQLSAAGFQDVSKGLQGKIAGVNVRQSSGMPGASSTINIRGISSLTGNNEPLYVIDGIPISSGRDFNELVGSGVNSSSRSLDINPDDIQSMDVLKGPAAAALYGLRASNGVIVITTKSGQGLKDGDMKISVSSDYTYDIVARLPEVQTTYSQGSQGNFAGGSSLSWGAKISGMGTYTNALGESEKADIYDNMGSFFRGGHTTTNSVNISKATSNGTYSIGVGSTNQSGIIRTTGMDRYNAKFNGLFNLNPDFKVGVAINYAHTNVDKVPGGSNLSNPLFTVYFAPTSYNLKEKPISDPSDPYKQVHYRSNMDNPYWSLKYNSATEKTNRFFGNINLDYKIIDWASVKYRVGLDNYTTTQDNYLELGSGGTSGRTNPPSGGQVETKLFTNNQFNSNLSVVLNKDLSEDLKGLLVIGNEIYDIRSDANTMIGRGISVGGFKHISNTSTLETSRTLSNQRVIGFYGNLNLDYLDMFFFNMTGRYDIVSNMPSK